MAVGGGLITREWVFTAAQTDALLLTVGAAERFLATFGQVYASNSNTGDVSLRLGLVTGSTLPAESATVGADGLLISHGGIARGGGAVLGRTIIGELGADLRVTCSNPAGGSLRLVLDFRILTDQE